jgi:hypothetical protein
MDCRAEETLTNKIMKTKSIIIGTLGLAFLGGIAWVIGKRLSK